MASNHPIASDARKPQAPFVVFGLPRSRTAWLSRFLNYGDWTCGHEELRHMRNLDDVKSWLSQPSTGTVETAAAWGWRLLPTLSPDAKILIIRRNVKEVIQSLMSVPGITFDRPSLEKGMIALDRKLDQIEARLPVMSVDYADLEDEGTCASIFEYCLPYRHDHDHWASLAPINIQMDMRAMVKQITAFRPQMERLGALARHRALADLTVGRKPVMADGITIQMENFETWLRDARALIEDHLVQIGEAPDDWRAKNLDLMRTLDEAGCMQIATARSNGRMFGYLMTLISPSLTSENVTTATNAAFYTSADTPGLGVKLQRASLRALKAKGVGEVFWEASKRGFGPKLGALYKRLGAVEHGSTFRLDLAAAA